MALQAYGPTAIHRRSWIFMEHLPWGVAGRRRVGRPFLDPEPADLDVARPQ
jgi:hypothetical protein